MDALEFGHCLQACVAMSFPPTERNGFRILLLSNEDTDTNTGRRDGGQGPELEVRATFYRMFAPSLKRCNIVK